MSRDAQIPLVLWITAAIVAHMAGGGGAATVSRVLQDKANMRAIVNSVRSTFAKNDTFEVLTDATPTPPDQKVEAPKEDPKLDAKSDDKDPDDAEQDKTDPKK